MALDLNTSNSGIGVANSTPVLLPGSLVKKRSDAARTTIASPAVAYDETVETDHTAVAEGEPARKSPWANGVDWPVVIFMSAVHIASPQGDLDIMIVFDRQ